MKKTGIASVYTVSQLSAYIRHMFSQDYLLEAVSVRGEVSNLKYHSSGHIYFSLKDDSGSITCVMFANMRQGLAFRLNHGSQVVVTGAVNVYEKEGRYQLYAKKITADGQGRLFEEFLRLKERLAEMGMFAAEYKQPIPPFIRSLGVVTSPTGAAIRDILSVVQRRNPYVSVLIYPALVQGEGAAESIVRGIEALAGADVDVMIVGRGGGSIEDLWAFNEEIVARAIFESPVPVITAIGHETDTSIADFAADMRTPTPSAAAELAVYDLRQLLDALAMKRIQLRRLLKNRLDLARYRLLAQQNRMKSLGPQAMIREKRSHAMVLEERLTGLMTARLAATRHQLSLSGERLNALSPQRMLARGYAYIRTASGQTLSDVGQTGIGEQLDIHLRNGRIGATVTEVKV